MKTFLLKLKILFKDIFKDTIYMPFVFFYGFCYFFSGAGFLFTFIGVLELVEIYMNGMDNVNNLYGAIFSTLIFLPAQLYHLHISFKNIEIPQPLTTQITKPHLTEMSKNG